MVSGKELVVSNTHYSELLKKNSLYASLSIAFQDGKKGGRGLYRWYRGETEKIS